MNKTPQNVKEYEKNVNSNKELAIKGRFLTASAFVLFLQCNSYIQLKKLPFVGATLEDTDTTSITWILLVVVIYAMYKYWVYKRDATLNTNMHIYSDRLRHRLLSWRFSVYFKKALPHILAHKRLYNLTFLGCSQRIKSPAHIVNKEGGITGSKGDWSTYDLKKWAYDSHLETSIPEISYSCDIKTSLPDEGCGIMVKSNFELHRRDNEHYEVATMDTYFQLPIKTYKRIKRLCDLAAYLSLPDFVEQMAPYLVGFIAIISCAITLA